MNKIIIKGLIDEDFLQYKYPSMVILFPNCTFKCNKENGKQVCQNDALALSPSIEINIDTIVVQPAIYSRILAAIRIGSGYHDNFVVLFQVQHELVVSTASYKV